jgi:hypothetical protein
MPKTLILPEKETWQPIPPDADARVLSATTSILNDQLGPGATKRGVPADYAGDDPDLCNARTKTGRPCRALGIEPSGRCKWHGGMSTGPRTAEGKAASAGNLMTRKKLRNRVVMELKRLGYDPDSHFAHAARARE